MNNEKRIDAWNEHITRIRWIPRGLTIGTELTIVQSPHPLVNKIQKVYSSQGMQIHNRHIEIIRTYRVVTGGTKGVHFGRSNLLSSYLIGNNKSISSYSNFSIRILAKAALQDRQDWLKGLKENVVLGAMKPVGTGFKGFVHHSNQQKNVPLKKKKRRYSREK
ncbi:hypothetical protein Cgig2_028253 [Carnegiea gigantea]|uniref:DNA-directed RNA polymerase n=1 Tax=Carnegiea gigantea TaxID=171969 RepID=A0A9Q1GN09_9CARY|nr:hypothetical protein Cgig2_028253 [Carnegiea gigantea]